MLAIPGALASSVMGYSQGRTSLCLKFASKHFLCACGKSFTLRLRSITLLYDLIHTKITAAKYNHYNPVRHTALQNAY